MPAYKSLHIKWKIMDVATRMSLLLIFFRNVHAKVWNPTIIAQGHNGTIYINMPKSEGETHLEIDFYGYTSDRHFTNILLYMNGQNENISVNSNYTGRIERVVNSNGQLSFLLLNVMFNDSGNYTIKEKSDVKETTCVLVTSRIYEAKIWKPLIFSFIVYENNTSFIRVENPMSKLRQPVVIYNASYNICTYIDLVSTQKKNITNCVLSNGEFSYTIPEIEWLHKGSYFAWDDKGRLLDSIFLDIQGNNITGSVETRLRLDIEKRTFDKELWFIISALGITIVCACLVVIAVWKLRVRTARMSTMDNSISRRGILAIDHRSNNAFIPNGTRRVLMKQNSNDLTELTTNQFQARFNLNDQNMCVRGLGCSKSSVNTNCNLQVDSSLSSAETMQSDSTHRYDYVHNIDELVSDCQSKQQYIRSNLLDTNGIGGKSQTSFEYSYVVQHRLMTLRPPAPEPVLKKKQNQQNIVANSFYSHKQVNKRSIRRYDPSILFARKKNQGTMESHRTKSSDDLSINCTNVVSSFSFVHLEKDFAKKDMDSPQKDSKLGSASQYLRDDYPGDDYDQAYAMKMRHRISWSNDALYGDRTFNTKYPRSRRFSTNSKPGSASQYSRADYPGDDYDQAYAMEKRYRRSWSNDALYGDRIFNTKAARLRRFSANSKPLSASHNSRADYPGDDYDQAHAMEKRYRRSWSNDALYGDRIFNTKAARSSRFSANSKPGSASQYSRADYPGDDYDQAHAMEKRYRRSWSNDALYGDRIYNTKAARSRRFSANSKPGSASQYSRADYPGDDYDQAHAMEKRYRRSWSNDALYGDRIFNTKAARSSRFSANFKPGCASQCSRADYPGDDYDQAYAIEWRHRRSLSNDALYGDRIFNTKAPRSRRFSASTCMDKDYYDCLDT